ncbi:MAG: mannose-1-phosphate guanylyltransferase [Candidatus Dojkabacteria bacterium]
MKIIIFAGGTGKRFWPVSRIDSPKQFQPVVDNKPLVRLAFERLSKKFAPSDIFVSTGKKYEKEVKEILNELPEENIILEQEMRDTGPAVTLGVSYVSKKYPDEVIAVLWSDHLVKDIDTFIECLIKSEENVKSQNKIVFITVPARFPSPHRGYINFSDDIEKYSDKIILKKFTKFVEKPTVEVAGTYLASGKYGWNPGYWVAYGKDFLNITARKRPDFIEVCKEIVDSDFKSGFDKFSKLEKISADYTFAELVKSEEALCMFSDFGWSDVGEWIALKEALQDSDESNVIKGNVIDMGSRDSIIHNYEDGKLVTTINLDGFVVVNTKDVVAIFKKTDNTKLKEYLKKLEDEGFTAFL